MSTQVHILVEYIDGKPNLTLGSSYTHKTRSFQVKGAAENYAEGIKQGVLRGNEYWRERAAYHNQNGSEQAYHSAMSRVVPVPDIRILSVSIPDDGPVKDGIFPGLLAVPAVSWS